MVVDGVEGLCDLMSRRGGARPVMGVDGRGDASVSPLVLSATVLLLLASFSMDRDIRFSSSSSSDAEFNSNSINSNTIRLRFKCNAQRPNLTVNTNPTDQSTVTRIERPVGLCLSSDSMSSDRFFFVNYNAK